MSEGFDLFSSAQADLQRRYLADLPDKSALIQGCWDRLQAQPSDHDALTRLSLYVHRLAGSAAPYGLPLLGEIAGSVDKIITPLASEGGSISSSTLKTLCPLMEKLRQRLEQPY
jgi:hypothetical protein